MLVLPTFPGPLELHTKRCVLRQCKGADLAPWAEMNANPEVRRHFPSLLSGEEAGAEAGDFDQPRIEPGHPLRRHVLYRASAAAGLQPATSGNVRRRARRDNPRRQHLPET